MLDEELLDQLRDVQIWRTLRLAVSRTAHRLDRHGERSGMLESPVGNFGDSANAAKECCFSGLIN